MLHLKRLLQHMVICSASLSLPCLVFASLSLAQPLRRNNFKFSVQLVSFNMRALVLKQYNHMNHVDLASSLCVTKRSNSVVRHQAAFTADEYVCTSYLQS